MTLLFDDFDVNKVRWQKQVIADINTPEKFDYSLGTHTIIFSGAVGSAKSVLAAHLCWRHLLKYPGSHVGIGRFDEPKLKSTAIKNFLEQRPRATYGSNLLGWKWKDDAGDDGNGQLANGSAVRGMYWGDGNIEFRFKSKEFTFFWVEEASENEEQTIYNFLMQRTRSYAHVEEKIILLTTNPGEPDHWINEQLIRKAGWVNGQRVEEGDPTIHVYYSLTQDNPFMGPNYYRQQLKLYNEMEVERFLHGKWISVYGKNIYYAYTPQHYISQPYQVDTRYHIHVTFDFNTALGKPMSACMYQYIDDKFHFFREFILQGNTTLLMQEMQASGALDFKTKYVVHGDVSGWAKQSAATQSFCDYDIIRKFFEQYRPDGRVMDFKIHRNHSNPEIKQRHNAVNTYLKNGLGEIRLFIYSRTLDTNRKIIQGCVKLDEGMRLTKLKPGAKFVEDDSKDYQHVTTALGYGLCDSIKAPASVSGWKPNGA